jgi:glycosyltransferase involved in cell wall biosynthesis
MDYFPNIDGVCYFAERILPLIRKQMPDVEFRIVGSNPSRKIRSLARIPHTVVTGHVPDVRAYIQEGAVAIAPLRIARGTQNKILESMSMGIPVVATSNAAKGIQAVPGRDLIVADAEQSFAAQVVALLQNASMRTRFAQAARKQVERAHLWANSMDILDSTLSNARRRPESILSEA